MLTVRNQQEFDQFCQVLQRHIVYKPTGSKQVEFWTQVRWGRGAFWGLSIAGKNIVIESSEKKLTLLAFVGICLAIISEWPPLSHRLLRFWWIELSHGSINWLRIRRRYHPFYPIMNPISVSDVILVGLVTKAIDRSKDVTPSQSNLFHFDTVFRTYWTKQESIPVGCVPTAP